MLFLSLFEYRHTFFFRSIPFSSQLMIFFSPLLFLLPPVSP